MNLASRLDSVTESKTLAIAAEAARLRRAGVEVISLSAGEPDFPTPDAIAAAGKRAIEDGLTRYTPADGLPDLKKKTAEALARDFGFDYAADEICMTAGTKPAIHLALLCLLEPGDTVGLFAPFWVSYPDIVHLAGGQTVTLACPMERGFLPSPEELEAFFAAHDLKAVILNSPTNPSGAVWPPELLERLVQLADAKGCWILSDEIYAQILFGGAIHVSPAQIPGGRRRTIVLGGLSKSFAMTGWRIGYLAGPRRLARAVAKVQSQVIGNPCSISQGAAFEALAERSAAARRRMLAAFEERRAFLIDTLPSVPGFEFWAPKGAFYGFPRVQVLCEAAGLDDAALAARILKEARVALVPGAAFGAPGHLRLSFAASLGELRAAVERLKTFAEGLLA